jgi:hypothetical protein
VAASLEQTIADAAVEIVGSGRKATDYVLGELWRKLVVDALEADERFACNAGIWELAAARDERLRAITGKDRGVDSPAREVRASKKRRAA